MCSRNRLRRHIYRKTSTLSSSAETGYLGQIRLSDLKIPERTDLPNLKGFEHRRMKNSKLTDLMCLAAETKIYSGSVTVEPHGLVNLFNPVAVRLGGVLCNFEVDALTLKTLFMCQESCSQHEQEAI